MDDHVQTNCEGGVAGDFVFTYRRSMVRQRWWSYAKNMIRDYPALYEELEAARSTSMVASYSAMPRGSGPSDPVAAAALRQLNAEDMRSINAVERAIRLTHIMHADTATARIELIRLLYWQRKYDRIDSAADCVGYSARQCRRFHKTFIYTVAFCYGLTDEIPEER